MHNMGYGPLLGWALGLRTAPPGRTDSTLQLLPLHRRRGQARTRRRPTDVREQWRERPNFFF
jgi:hypothetical protein